MTVYEALKAELGREPKSEELRAEVQRIIREGAELAMTRRAKRIHADCETVRATLAFK